MRHERGSYSRRVAPLAAVTSTADAHRECLGPEGCAISPGPLTSDILPQSPEDQSSVIIIIQYSRALGKPLRILQDRVQKYYHTTTNIIRV
jgi:hypothetical protein